MLLRLLTFAIIVAGHCVVACKHSDAASFNTVAAMGTLALHAERCARDPTDPELDSIEGRFEIEGDGVRIVVKDPRLSARRLLRSLETRRVEARQWQRDVALVQIAQEGRLTMLEFSVLSAPAVPAVSVRVGLPSAEYRRLLEFIRDLDRSCSRHAD